MKMFNFYFVLFFFISSLINHSSSKINQNKEINNPNCIKNLTLSNQYGPYFKSSKICNKNMKYTLVPFGEKYNFNCSYESNPPSKVIWTKMNKSTNSLQIIERLNNNSKLSIESTSLDDDGFYTCFVTNNLHSVSHGFYLKVNDLPLVHPMFKYNDEEFIGKQNGQINLDCTYTTDEISNLTFYKANHLNNYSYEELIKLNDYSKRADNVLYLINSTYTFDPLDNESNLDESPFTLTIDHLTEDHFGIYMCVAQNRYGKSVKFINLKKEQPDYFKIILYVVISIVFILMILIIFQVYLKNRVKKKLLLEKQKPKSYVITKKITIDYGQTKADLNNQIMMQTNPHSIELNSYMNCPVVPRVEIVKKRKEIIGDGTTNDQLNQMEDYFEIDLDPNWEIDRDCLKLDETIGHGNFGIVQRAFLYNLPLISKDISKNKSIYVNDNVYASTKKSVFKATEPSSKQTSPVTYTDINQLNYNYIIDHFKNNSLNNNITAFSNNYYGIQDTIQFGQYGRLEFIKSSNEETNNDNRFERKCRIVAVKKLRQDYNETDVKNFISEMVMMKLYGNHPNIINLIGICTQDGPFYVIMEYAEKGNLKDFLKKYQTNNCRIPFTNELRLTSKDLISFALQIASGMQHLARLHCIHRDLAARNVLVTSNLIMKIADFGLSRNTGDSEYYRKSSDSFVPIKWLAPECISCSLYTIQTDVWSYAVTLWELTSLGNSPYEKVDPKNMYLYLQAGNRMSKPLWSNDEMYKLMLDCWNWDPKNRPLFDEIISRLELMYQNESEIRYIINQDLPTPESSINSDYLKDEYLR